MALPLAPDDLAQRRPVGDLEQQVRDRGVERDVEAMVCWMSEAPSVPIATIEIMAAFCWLN